MFYVLLQCAFALFVQIPDDAARSLWYGELDAGQRVFRFVVTAKLDQDGKWQGQLKSLDEGGAKFNLDNLVMSDSDFSFQLKQTKAVYSGKFDQSEKRERATGDWIQGGAKIALSFRRVDSVPVDQPKETWLGEMAAGGQKLSMQIRVYQAEDGSQRTLIDSLSQGAGGFKGILKKTGDAVEVDVSSLASKYSGKLSADGQQMDGKWKQGLANLDLVLKKIEQPKSSDRTPPKRPQTPKPPFTYDTEEVAFENIAAGIKLSGTLTLPNTADDKQRFPVAILVSGSGPQDRDESLYGHKPFWVLADHLTRNGFAVLRYDERGVGKSSGNFDGATTADFAQDAACAVDFLKKHSRVDPKKIGLIGHSEGGLVAPLVASKDAQVAWIVLMAGPGVNGEQIMYSQGRLMILAAGGDETVAQRNRFIQEVAFTAANELKPGEISSEVLDTLAEKVLEKAKKQEGSELEIADAEKQAAIKKLLVETIRANLQAMNTPWFNFFKAHEPGPVLEQVRCPVLAINGEKDTQVDPKLNLPKIVESLKAGGNQQVTTMELTSLNHLFQTAQRGALSEYEAIEETIAPLALNSISDWLKSL